MQICNGHVGVPRTAFSFAQAELKHVWRYCCHCWYILGSFVIFVGIPVSQSLPGEVGVGGMWVKMSASSRHQNLLFVGSTQCSGSVICYPSAMAAIWISYTWNAVLNYSDLCALSQCNMAISRILVHQLINVHLWLVCLCFCTFSVWNYKSGWQTTWKKFKKW